jgi:NAD(P)-dependent dehydrogenase (short-subunit alcohol dehydrogenase family)
MTTKSRAFEPAPFYRGVNSVCPGVVIPEILETLGISKEKRPEPVRIWDQFHPIDRVETPNNIAKGILFFASDDSSCSNGSILNINWGICAE